MTINELINNNINTDEVDLITVHMDDKIIAQCDNKESLASELSMVVEDYEVTYDVDEGSVYLDIYV